MNRDFLSIASQGLEDAKRRECYKSDIRMWAKDKLGLHLWSKQVEIAEALIHHKKVAVKSCHGSGKSYFASVVVAWWVDTRYGTEAVVVSTAPTFEQVNKVLWRYIRQHHKKNELIGKVTQEDVWKDEYGEPLAWGRKPADTNLHGFQGTHSSGGVLAVLDEACGLVESMWTGVESITTGAHDRILAIGNPDDIATEFGRIFHPRSATRAEEEKNFGGEKSKEEWVKITISAFDTPNFTKEEMPEIAKAGMVTPAWAEEKKHSWGEDSPRYKSKVLGEFSEDASSTLFPLGTLNKGTSTELEQEIPDDSTPVLGVDVARMGEDYTVVYSYHHGVLRLVDKWNKTGSVETAMKIVNLAWELGAKEVRIDGVGLGGPVVDFVVSKSDARFEVVSMLGNGATPDPDKWFNARAYWYDDLRERMFRGMIDIAYDDVELQDELGDLQYHFNNPRNALQIEKKEEIRKRTGKSPDFADAAVYAAANIGIDPTSPEAKLKIGETYQMDLNELLMEHELSISPF